MALWDVHLAYPDPASSTFATQSLAFDEGNDPARFADMFNEFVVTGMLHDVPSPGSLTSDSFSGEFYTNAGAYGLQESTTITYNLGNGQYWTIATGDTELVSAGWTRRVGSHLMYKIDGVQPTIPDDSVLLMSVTVAGSVITDVQDMRKTSPIDDDFERLLFEWLEDEDFIAAIEDIVRNLILNDPEIEQLIRDLINEVLAGVDFVAVDNVGAGTGEIFRDTSGHLPETINLKTIKAGDGIVLTNGADDIELDVSITNVGSGENIYKDATGTTLNFRGILGVGDIDVTTNGDNIEVEFGGYTGGMVVEGFQAGAVTTTTADPVDVMTLNTTPDTAKDTVLICTMNIHNVSTSSDSGDNNDTIRLYKGAALVRQVGYEAEDLWSKTITIQYVDTSPGTNQQYSIDLVDLKNIGIAVYNASMIAIQF